MEVTLCIMTLNEEAFIEECLKHHLGFAEHVVVLDGGSTDKTLEILGKYEGYPITFIYEPGLSGDIAALRNKMQDAAPTDWCLHVDSDERFNLNFLAKMSLLIEKYRVLCFGFPRENRDTTYPPLDPQDWQVRLVNKRFGVWMRPVHEIVRYRHGDKPLDQMGDFYVKSLPEYPIIHLPKDPGVRSKIQERWKQMESGSS